MPPPRRSSTCEGSSLAPGRKRMALLCLGAALLELRALLLEDALQSLDLLLRLVGPPRRCLCVAFGSPLVRFGLAKLCLGLSQALARLAQLRLRAAVLVAPLLRGRGPRQRADERAEQTEPARLVGWAHERAARQVFPPFVGDGGGAQPLHDLLQHRV